MWFSQETHGLGIACCVDELLEHFMDLQFRSRQFLLCVLFGKEGVPQLLDLAPSL